MDKHARGHREYNARLARKIAKKPASGKAGARQKRSVRKAILKARPSCATIPLKRKPAMSGAALASQVSLTGARPMHARKTQSKGRPRRTGAEAPGPAYIPDALAGKKKEHLARAPIATRIAVVDLARIPPDALARVMIEIGVLPDLGGTCEACGYGTMELKVRSSQSKHECVVAGYNIPNLDAPIWRCSNWECQKRTSNLDPGGPLGDLFKLGTVNNARTLLAIAHAVSQHGSGYESSYEMATQVGMSPSGAEHICRVVRDICSRAAQCEQNSFQWPRGCLVEADEASMRAVRVPCPSDCKEKSCKGHPLGRYRLLHHRFMCVCPRGHRDKAMFFELPERTCAAGGSGVSLNAKECDDVLSWVLVPGNFTLLTDGAGAYQSVAPKSRASASVFSKKIPHQWFSKERHELHYKHLALSHGIVSHDAEEWVSVGRIKVVRPNGRAEWISIKKGTQIVDGLWPEMRSSIPDAVRSTDWARCRSYIWSWVWRMRRTGQDSLPEFGKAVRDARARVY